MTMKKWIALAVCVALLCALAATGGAESAVQVPEVNALRQCEIPDNEAMAFLKAMGVGWNLGNTFDATQDSWPARKEMDIETSWVGTATTEELIAAVHDAGFNTIRIPVSWHNHVSGDGDTISEAWLSRVQQVVDWAVGCGMYVILNTHHDVYPEYYYPDEAHYERSAAYLGHIWTQLAERFKDYDEHLILESMNEPRLKDTDYEWVFNASEPACAESAACINRLNQLFVDTVRASGGQNATRYLMVPGYDAAPENAVSDAFVLPTDTADNRIIVSVHAYTPYSFALQDGGVKTFDIHLASQTNDINYFINNLYKKYITQGIPVVIGEFGARDKDGNLQERVNFAAYYTHCASARNIPCCWWDNHAFKGNGELFGLIDRKTCSWKNPEIVEAIMRYAGYDNVPAAQ